MLTECLLLELGSERVMEICMRHPITYVLFHVQKMKTTYQLSFIEVSQNSHNYALSPRIKRLLTEKEPNWCLLHTAPDKATVPRNPKQLVTPSYQAYTQHKRQQQLLRLWMKGFFITHLLSKKTCLGFNHQSEVASDFVSPSMRKLLNRGHNNCTAVSVDSRHFIFSGGAILRTALFMIEEFRYYCFLSLNPFVLDWHQPVSSFHFPTKPNSFVRLQE